MKSFYIQYLNPSIKNNKGFRELVLFLSFLLFYKISRFIAIGDELTAFENAHKLVDFEKWIGIFREISVQQSISNQPQLIRWINQFYMIVHLPSTILFFVWLYHKHSSYYKFIRNGFFIANTFALVSFIVYPCAPPRMLNDIGFTDTLLQVSNINLYSGFFSGLFNQYAAVPSMHFGNALLIGVVVVALSKNKFFRWIILFYPVFVLYVIVVTGNHFFLDAIIGGIIVILPYPILSLRCRVVALINKLSPSINFKVERTHCL